MFLITNFKLNRKVRREHKAIAEATARVLEIREIEQKAVYRYMDELSAQGFDFINPPKASN